MVMHRTLAELLRESIAEYLVMACVSLDTQKVTGGVYGFPAALLLLSVVDAIGSYYVGNTAFTVDIDGRPEPVNKKNHYRILNGPHFELKLSHAQIDGLYEQYRCLLTHNAADRKSVV